MNYFIYNVFTLQLLTDRHQFEITLKEQTLQRKKENIFNQKHPTSDSICYEFTTEEYKIDYIKLETRFT